MIDDMKVSSKKVHSAANRFARKCANLKPFVVIVDYSIQFNSNALGEHIMLLNNQEVR